MHPAGLKIEVCTKPSLLKFHLVAMASAKDKCKRALVTLLRNLARLYEGVTRDSTEAEIRKAYCALSRKVYPERGGDTEARSDSSPPVETGVTQPRPSPPEH